MPIAAAVAVRKNIAKPIPKTICMGCPLTIMGAGEKAVVEAGEATEQQSFLLALSAVSGRRDFPLVNAVGADRKVYGAPRCR